MGSAAKIDRVSFAGGELGPQLGARADLAKYQIAVEKLENYVVMKGGGVTRAPGTRLVLELKNEAQRGALIPFRRSSTDYYALVINGGVSRFVRDGGFLQNPDTTPYEMVVPWTESELPNLRAAQAGDTIFVASGTKQPQQIVRTGNLSWSCSAYVSDSGPVDTENSDAGKTIQAGAVTGAGIALSGSGSPFSADMVGGVMRLDDRDLSLTPGWSAAEDSVPAGAQRRWNGNVYQAMVTAAAGVNAPVHTEGDVSAGAGKQTWRYLHSGYGIVRITAFTSVNSVTADVVKRLPDSVVSGATSRWSAPAWTSGKGWPELVAYNYPRLGWYRQNIFWLTADDDARNFDLGAADDTDAIAGRVIAPDGSLVEIKWALPSGPLLLGTSDIEWVLRGPSVFDALTPKTMKPYPIGSDGSAPQVAVAVDGGVMFVGRTRKRLHYTKFDAQQQQLNSNEISVSAEHIFAKGLVGTCWQRDPFRVLWMWFDDGSIASLTWMPEQQMSAFCRHPRVNMFVEHMCCVPSVSSGSDQVYLIVRRTINGQTRRFVEQFADYFAPVDPTLPTAAGAWFVDCGLRITGSKLTQITQLGHLEGETVAVLADGAMQTRKVVTNGTIQLDRPSDDVIVGLPIRGYIRDLPRNFNTQAGGTADLQKTIHEAAVHVMHAGGGRVRVYNSEEDNPELWEPLIETGTSWGAWPDLFSGKKRLTVEGNLLPEAQLEFECDDALPSTVLALLPIIDVME
ncbi:hypothetical protein LOC51_19875 [Rubrivivax sp. JA1024]|nr:hypothetical protein [Rubrivivax sp. JA1024]